MSHAIEYLDYHCSKSKTSIMKEISRFAYDPQESSGYHGNLTWHDEPVYPNREAAVEAIKKFDKGWYSDHAVAYRSGRKKYYLVKVEWHC